jgi:hypothetical protein
MIAFGRPTLVRISRTHGNAVLVVVVAMGRVQVSLVDIVRVIIVSDRRVAAALAVFMTMIAMDVVTHRAPPIDLVVTAVTFQN